LTYELKFDGYRALIINQSSPSGRRLTTWAALGVMNVGARPLRVGRLPFGGGPRFFERPMCYLD